MSNVTGIEHHDARLRDRNIVDERHTGNRDLGALACNAVHAHDEVLHRRPACLIGDGDRFAGEGIAFRVCCEATRRTAEIAPGEGFELVREMDRRCAGFNACVHAVAQMQHGCINIEVALAAGSRDDWDAECP